MPEAEDSMLKLSPSEPYIVFVLDVYIRRDFPLTKAAKILGGYGYKPRINPPYTLTMRTSIPLSASEKEGVSHLKALLVELSSIIEAICVEHYIVVHRKLSGQSLRIFYACNRRGFKDELFMICNYKNSTVYMKSSRRKTIIRILDVKDTVFVDPLFIPRTLYRKCSSDITMIAEYIEDKKRIFIEMMNALSIDQFEG